MRCCGISVSFVVGTSTTTELPVSSSNRKSKTVDDVDNNHVAPETNSVTTHASYEISTLAEPATTTQKNRLDSLNDMSETNEFTRQNFPYDAITTDASADEKSTGSTTENDILMTTTDIPLEIVHRDGEIIDNVMIFYPSEMSGKPNTKPDDMPIDANEFHIHDDAMGIDLHIIYPTNESEARFETRSTEAIRTTTIQPSEESTTQFIETMAVTPSDLPKKSLALVTPSHASSTSNIMSTETVASSTELAVDLKSEASELANQIENVTVTRPRYKRRKLKLSSYLSKSSTTTITPTGTPTLTPAYKLQSRFHPSSSKSDGNPQAKSTEANIVAESSTRRVFLQQFKLMKSRNQSTKVQRRNDPIVGDEHEMKINALHNLLTDTMNATNSLNITNFLIQRSWNDQGQSAIRKILNVHRANPPKDLYIASTTSTPALTISTSIETAVATEAPIDLTTTLASTTSLRERFRFNRRRNPFQGIYRGRNNVPSAKTTPTEAATTTKPSGTTTPNQSQSNGVRDILRRRRPIKRPSSIASNPLDIDVAAKNMNAQRNVQKIRKRTKIGATSGSKRKLLGSLRRRAPSLSTTESNAADPLVKILQRKRSTTTTTETAVDIRTKPTRRYRRRQTTTAPTSASTSEPNVKLNQSYDTNSAESIEITTIRTTYRTPMTSTTISTTTTTETSSQPDFDANMPVNKSDDGIVHPTQTPKEYTEIRRPAVEGTQLTELEQTVSHLRKTETFPDMHLPNEVTKPFNREPVGPRNAQQLIAPHITPAQSNPTHQIGQSPPQSETSLQAHQTLPIYVQNQYPTEILQPQSATPIPHQYYTNQNDPLANRFHRMTSATLKPGQTQQRIVPYITHMNPYVAETSPSPFGRFNFPFIFF